LNFCYSYWSFVDENPTGIYEGGHPGRILGVADGVSHSLSVVAVHLSILSD